MSHDEEYLPTNQRKSKIFTENGKTYYYIKGVKYKVITESIIKKEKGDKNSES